MWGWVAVNFNATVLSNCKPRVARHVLQFSGKFVTLCLLLFLFFFFSSRRRHTRFDCDWSSDVCSSDLHALRVRAGRGHRQDLPQRAPRGCLQRDRRLLHGQRLRHTRLPGELLPAQPAREEPDRKSTRLNSSHSQISYAVFCLKKKKKTT